MRLERQREELVWHAKRMERDGLAVGTSGNLSIRNEDLVAITPVGIDFDALKAEMCCVVELDGNFLEGDALVSTELPMHLAVYRTTEAEGVVHTHSRFASVMSTLVDELPAIHYLIAFLGGSVSVAPYAVPGTSALADAMINALGDRSAVLLRNHGALTTGPSLESAYGRSRLLEWLCDLYYHARVLGEPLTLTDAEVKTASNMLGDFGL